MQKDAVASGVAPGTFFGATSAEGTLYASGAGVRAYGAPETAAVDGESVFWICSMTKLVVSVRPSRPWLMFPYLRHIDNMPQNH